MKLGLACRWISVFTSERRRSGVAPEKLAVLRRMIVSEEIRTEHNGLQNISRRLILKYGDECGLFLDSEEEILYGDGKASVWGRKRCIGWCW